MHLGRVLGRGGFCCVNEVSSVKLLPDEKQQEKSNSQIKTSDTQSDCDHHRLQDRQFMSKNYLRDGHPRYAFKTLSKYL